MQRAKRYNGMWLVGIEDRLYPSQIGTAVTLGLASCIGCTFYSPNTKERMATHDTVWSILEKVYPPDQTFRQFLEETRESFDFENSLVTLAGSNTKNLAKGIIKTEHILEAREKLYHLISDLGINPSNIDDHLGEGERKQAILMLGSQISVHEDTKAFRDTYGF